MAIATQAIPKYLEYRLGEKEKKRNYEHQIGLEMLRQQMWKKRLRAQALKEKRDRQMLIEREKIALQGDIAKQNRMLKEHQDEMNYKDKLYKLKERELGIADKKAQADIIKAQRSGEKTSRDQTLSELLKMLGTTQQQYYQDIPLEGTGDPAFEMALKQKLGQFAKQKYGVKQPFSGARNRGDLAGAIGKAYSQRKPKESWRDYLE